MSRTDLPGVLYRLTRAEQDPVIFSHQEIQDWEPGLFDALQQNKILNETTWASEIYCPGCEKGRIEPVEFADDLSETEGRIECSYPKPGGYVWVSKDKVRQWSIDLNRLVVFIGVRIDSDCRIEIIEPGRLWSLGRPMVDGRRADIFIARQPRDSSRRTWQKSGVIKQLNKPLVLTLTPLSDGEMLFGKRAEIRPMHNLLVHKAGELSLDADEISHVIQASRRDRVQKIRPYAMPPNITWEKMLLTIKDDNEHQLIVKIGPSVSRFTYVQMGFADNRTKERRPDRLWQVLLFLAMHDGAITWEDNSEMPDLTKKHVSELGKRLKAFYGISDPPFQHYSKEHAYKTRFVIKYLRS